MGAGAAGVLDKDQILYFMTEFRFKQHWKGISTRLSLHSSDEEFYFAAGIYRDFYISKHWVISPGLDLGVQHEGRKLGSPLEIKSSVELAYSIIPGRRIGLRMVHVSNGGLGDENPGSEMLSLFLVL